jgi:hypothetical protein
LLLRRVIDTPISQANIAGAAGGMALAPELSPEACDARRTGGRADHAARHRQRREPDQTKVASAGPASPLIVMKTTLSVRASSGQRANSGRWRFTAADDPAGTFLPLQGSTAGMMIKRLGRQRNRGNQR